MITVSQKEWNGPIRRFRNVVLAREGVASKRAAQHQLHCRVALYATQTNDRLVTIDLVKLLENISPALNLLGTHRARTPNQRLTQMLDVRNFFTRRPLHRFRRTT